MEQVGGDVYDIFQLEKKIGLMVADITGRGVRAALSSFMLSMAFQNSLQKERHDASFRDESDEYRNSNNRFQGAFASMFYALYDLEEKRLSFSSAGHPPALIGGQTARSSALGSQRNHF